PLRLWGRGPGRGGFSFPFLYVNRVTPSPPPGERAGERWLFFCVPLRQSGYSLSASGGEGRGEVAFLLRSSASIGLLPLRLWGRGAGEGGLFFCVLLRIPVRLWRTGGGRVGGACVFLCFIGVACCCSP